MHLRTSVRTFPELATKLNGKRIDFNRGRNVKSLLKLDRSSQKGVIDFKRDRLEVQLRCWRRIHLGEGIKTEMEGKNEKEFMV
jgi:hypothetical protein